MPIGKREFERGKLVAEEDKAIESFLSQNHEMAYSEAELVDEMAKVFGFVLGQDILDDMQFRERIGDALKALVKDRKVERKRIDFTLYYRIARPKKRRLRTTARGAARVR